MLAMSMAMPFTMVPKIWAPVSAIEAVMLKVPLGFMGMPPVVVPLEDPLLGNEMGSVVPPMVMESGSIEDIELRPPMFIS